MKFLIVLFSFLPIIALAQSPHITIKFRCEEIMYHGDTCQSFYSVQLNQFKPKTAFPQSDWSSNDTSIFDWWHFNIDEAESEFNKINLITDSLQTFILKYVYSQDDYVFENVFEIIINRIKCGVNEQMRIFFPVKISSLITDIKLSPVYFIPGDFNLTNDFLYNIDLDSKLIYLYLKDNYWIR
jgi:hypothetical protein